MPTIPEIEYANLRNSFCQLPGAPASDFDHMARVLAKRMPSWDERAAAGFLCHWLTVERQEDPEALHSERFDLDTPGGTARALAFHSRPRVWAALCGRAVRS